MANLEVMKVMRTNSRHDTFDMSKKRRKTKENLCQRWGPFGERRHCQRVRIPRDTERRQGDCSGGSLVYFGAELGYLITPSIIAAFNKQARKEMHFHLHCCCLDPWLI